MYSYLSFLLSLFCLPQIIIAQSDQDHQASALSQIEALILQSHNKGLFNGGVTIFLEDNIVLDKSYGFTDGSQSKPLNSQSIFSIGSIAKEYKRVAIMQLEENGKLSLNDPISTFFPEFPAWSDSVTINHLLDYASGLPQLDFKSVKSQDDLFHNLIKTKQLETVPGEAYLYNHNIPILLNNIIERSSGLSFNMYIKKKILKPCHLKNTLLDPDSHPNLALSYNDKLENDTPYNPFTGWIYCNSFDLNLWQRAVHDNKILSEESYARLIRNDTFEGRNTSLGTCSTEDNEILCYHWGGYFNYTSLTYSNPTRQLYISFISNNGSKSLLNLARQIDAILY